MKHAFSRRRFAGALGRGALAVGAVSALDLLSWKALAASELSADDWGKHTESLTQFAWFLLPVLPPTHERYRMVAERVRAEAGHAPPLAGLVGAGVAALNRAGDGDWLALPPARREEIVGAQAGTPFFGYMRFTAAEVVMREPTLWQRLGYEGSAIEHGGYLHRGFDDIDWLPQEGVAQ